MPLLATDLAPVKILIVDDKPENRLALEAVLADLEEVTLVEAESGPAALALLPDHEFALILLDVQMPGLDGFATAERIRAQQTNQQVPIIFITAMHTEDHSIFKGYDSGAVDYLAKPFKPKILRSKVKIFCELFRQKKIIQSQLETIKTLEGMLPICCQCKKIRNSQGSWEVLESYIQSHTQATFSHGLCPHCIKELYPSL